ncbi:MAG: DUF2723 domain-containing protein [Gammaproteobacteria bacterium]|nr:DUF2723 domain-containing protein [Gammaproteobacteria bacterium]
MSEISPQTNPEAGSVAGIDKTVFRHGAAIFSILLIVYLATMPITVALEDDGLFALSSYEPGISHPPGYPLHTIIGYGFSKIPLGSVAARIHAVSAFFGALTCMLVFLLIDRLIACRSMAYLGALSYGLSLRFWSQSIIAEVYTLNTFIFFLLFYLCLCFMEDRGATDKRKWFIGTPGWLLGSIAFIYGLSFTNHWPLMVLSTPALLVLLWPKRNEVLAALGFCMALAIMGLAPYLWMFFYSQTDPYISFYGPLENLSELWFFISRQGYSSVDNSVSANLNDNIQYIGFFLRESTIQYGIVAFGLSCIGAWAQFKYLRNETAIALILAFLGNSVLLALLLGFDYDLIFQSAFRVYPLIAYGVMSIWLALGAYWLTGYLYQRASISVPELKLRYLFTMVVATLIFIKNLPANYRHDYVWAEAYAEFILSNLKRDAVLIAHDDVAIGTVGYLNWVKKIRPDISLFNKFGLLLGNRLYSPLDDSAETGKQNILAFIKASQRPVYYLNELDSGYGYKSYLFYYEVNKSSPPGSVEIILSQDNLNFLIALVNQKQARDSWTEIYRILLLETIVPEISTALANSETGQVSDTLKDILVESLRLFNCQLARIKWLMRRSDEADAAEIEQLLGDAELNLHDALRKSDVAEFYQQRAQWYLRQEMLEPAFESYQTSIDSWFHPENQSVNEVLKLYKLHGRSKQFDELIAHMNARL